MLAQNQPAFSAFDLLEKIAEIFDVAQARSWQRVLINHIPHNLAVLQICRLVNIALVNFCRRL